ncbi:MAG: hypothetical protein D6737_05830 [Chloroflexi bacterium]|nr:MAG: hypothetical protein D6737_05830 [Chloroflexota bacterium]
MAGTYSLQRDLDEAKAMVAALEPYVYEERLYGRLGGGFFSRMRQVSLTLGALWLRQRRLTVLEDQLDKSQKVTLKEIRKTHDAVRRKWRVHYEQKLITEATSRLKQIDHYYRECREDPASCHGTYMPEASRRTIVQEILLAMETYDIYSADLMVHVKQADGQLRLLVKPSDFIWPEALQIVYPREEFWWLYNRPPLV